MNVFCLLKILHTLKKPEAWQVGCVILFFNSYLSVYEEVCVDSQTRHEPTFIEGNTSTINTLLEVLRTVRQLYL